MINKENLLGLLGLSSRAGKVISGTDACIEYINKNFISVLITVEHKTSYPIELFYTTNFPSIFFASHKDESFLTHPIYNFKSKEEFIDILKSIKIK